MREDKVGRTKTKTIKRSEIIDILKPGDRVLIRKDADKVQTRWWISKMDKMRGKIYPVVRGVYDDGTAGHGIVVAGENSTWWLQLATIDRIYRRTK